MRGAIAICLVVCACSYDYAKLRRASDGGVDVPVSSTDVAEEAAGDRADLGLGGDRDAVGGERGTVSVGEGCTSGDECESGYCSDGVCCESACSGVCRTCAAPGRAGTCVVADLGSDPRGDCDDQGATTCKRTGQCDGTGACAVYPAGTLCTPAGCIGFTLVTAGRCDGAGTCSGAVNLPCTPFQCAPSGQCRTTCSVDADCTAPSRCMGGSCGPKPLGASCGAGAECNSGICAQGVCCATACTGTCKSCAIPQSQGTCTSVPAGEDPLMQCTDQGAALCGLDGTCDGTGNCRTYLAGSICGTSSCTAGTAVLPGKCSGSGICGAGSLQNCSPYACGATSCQTKCASNVDCASGFVCNGLICTKRVNSAPCSSPAECASGYCEQGVCCNTGCAAACVACDLTGTVGTCSPIPTGMAPKSATQCMDMGSTSCGTDGKCNGNGACRMYAAGTACGAASCTGSTLAAPRSCDGMGTCRAATTSSCAPYQCGADVCKTSCTSTAADCTPGNMCVSMSCGKIPIGGTCASGLDADCASGHCVNNVCCNSSCTGTCMSCGLKNSVGTCSPIAAGDPPLIASQCPAAAASTCGNDGTCNGAGACRKYVSGTQCAAPSCTGATATFARVCDGAGTCAAATTSACGRYTCDVAAGVCRTGCTTANDCVSPNICNANICTLKPIGLNCLTAVECDSGFCSQGVCCNQACTGTCKSCAISGSVGTCSNVANGTAPTPPMQCATTASTTCGTDGMCNGAGACRLWATGTQCAPATCTGSTLTPQRTCDGAGVCRSVTSTLCDPYLCSGTTPTCRMACTIDADCVATNTCVGASCGKLADGAPCTVPSDCAHNSCEQGVCCATICAGTCVSCALTGTAGTCTAVPAGQDPLNQCTDQGVAACGTDGSCNGSGACRLYGAGTQCVPASCTGSTLTLARTCNGTGTCQAATTSSCGAYACGTGACKTSCSASSDCSSSPYVCIGTSCTSATTLTVKLKGDPTATQWVFSILQITNNGTTAIPMSDLTVRYWYTYDTTPVVAQADMCSYSFTPPGACTNITRSWVAVTPARTNADFYYQMGFVAAAGNLNAGATAEFDLGFHKNDFSTFMQSNDYSYNAASSFVTTTKVTVYRVGTLVYGTEPP